MLKKFSVISLGCRVNRAESDDYSAYLISKGWVMSDVNEADLVLVNTCTVTHVADKKTRKTVRKVCKENTKARIILTGCAAAMDSSFYKKIDKRIEIIPKHKLPVGKAKVLAGDNFRTRASIKIQDGCDNACTYCIVHVARGKSISINKEIIVSRFHELINAGVKEVVLTGVNLGAYNDLAGLLKELVNDDCRIRLSSIEPQNVSDELIDLIAESNGKICKHLHLPLQSGSSKVLKDMARHYDADEYFQLVKKLREKIPTIALSTDIIVGFPGETDEEFEETVDLAKKCGFMKIHVFPYSQREGTPAARRFDQIPEDIKHVRAAKLRKLSDELADKDYESRIGTKEIALVETPGAARTESYHLVGCDVSNSPGEIFEYFYVKS